MRIAVVVAFALAVHATGICRAAEVDAGGPNSVATTAPPPTDPMRSMAQPTVFFEKHGLDPIGDPIDRLLDLFGGGCVPVAREATGRPCRIEKELSLLIDMLPRDARGLSDALIALGARCNTDSSRPIPVDCVYKKQVQVVGWVFGESTPRGIVYDSFMIHVTATLDKDILRARIEFNRTSEKVK